MISNQQSLNYHAKFTENVESNSNEIGNKTANINIKKQLIHAINGGG